MLDLKDTTDEKYYVRIGVSNIATSYFRLNNQALAKKYAEEFLELNKGSKVMLEADRMSKMIINHNEDRNWEAINNIMELNDVVQKNTRKFLINSSKAQALVFDQNISQFENKILAQENSIKNLSLISEKRKNKIAELTIFIIAAFSLAVLIFTVSLWRSKKKFVQLAQIDYLTKIANRRYIFEAGQNLIDKSISRGHSLYLFIFDIDDFKLVNDNQGHDMGDQVLKQVTKACSQLLSENSLFGRIGGEEFIYLIPNLSDEEAINIADQIRVGVSKINFNENNQSTKVTISTGISTTDQIIRMDELVKQADMALYESKDQGKNRVTFYSP